MFVGVGKGGVLRKSFAYIVALINNLRNYTQLTEQLGDDFEDHFDDEDQKEQLEDLLSDCNEKWIEMGAECVDVLIQVIHDDIKIEAAKHLFRANSIHDPDYSGTFAGGQPYGHDTYYNIYNHYQVLRSTIVVQGNPASQLPAPGIGVLLNDDVNIIEDESRQLCAMKGASYMMTGVGGLITVKRSFNTKYMQNKVSQCAAFGSDVADPMFFVVFSMDDSSADTVLYATVTINYTVKMWELKDLSST